MNLAIALGASLMLASSASFADPAQGMLPTGKPAGLRQAQEGDNTALYIIGGLAAVGIIIAIAASGGDDSSTANTGPPVPTQH